MTFKIIENGIEYEHEIVLTFRDENNDVNYVIYRDNVINSNGGVDVCASRYIKEGDNYILTAIENDYEWNLIDSMLESKYKEIGEYNEKN